MEFAVEFKIPDDKAQAPPLVVDWYELQFVVYDEFLNDYDIPYGVGSVLTIERIK